MSDSAAQLLQSLLPTREACDCGREHILETRSIHINDHKGDSLADVVEKLIPAGRALFVFDANMKTPATEVMLRMHDAGRECLGLVAGESGCVNVDDAQINATTTAAENVRPGDLAVVIGFGSGSVNDLGKVVATNLKLPYIAYPTAASMNGYLSTVAATKRAGLKVTEPTVSTTAVVADLDIISAAPPAMTAAGFADLLSKEVCHADWTLARIVENEYHCDIPAKLAAEATRFAIDNVDEIATATRTGIESLMNALLISGAAMALAGSSSPASGGEHLISHYWDMKDPHTGGRRFHGTQVGIGIILCSTLYDHLKNFDPGDIKPHRVADESPSKEALTSALADHFGDQAPPVIEQAMKKHRSKQQARERASWIQEHWNEIWEELTPIIRPPVDVRNLLDSVGAPTAAFDIGISAELTAAALRWSRFIRGRYTVLEFASDIGQWSPNHQARILKNSGVI
jgi:glycerol-1-phosphate dehydrogenase [NAD(P)+]